MSGASKGLLELQTLIFADLCQRIEQAREQLDLVVVFAGLCQRIEQAREQLDLVIDPEEIGDTQWALGAAVRHAQAAWSAGDDSEAVFAVHADEIAVLLPMRTRLRAWSESKTWCSASGDLYATTTPPRVYTVEDLPDRYIRRALELVEGIRPGSTVVALAIEPLRDRLRQRAAAPDGGV